MKLIVQNVSDRG